MKSQLRGLALSVRIMFHEPHARARDSIRVCASVDWTGCVTTDSKEDHERLVQWDVIELHATGPEDSEWFLTDEVHDIFAPQLRALSSDGGGGWKVVVPEIG